MRYILGVVVLLASSTVAHAATGYFKYDYLSGTDRICVYQYLGNEYPFTVRAFETCPPTHDVPD